MAARTLMFQGTGSDVGKSLLVAGLCRALVQRGLSVLPFKPQNMSNNAAVAGEGFEIGRAQALQALACRAAPTIHMNPVLLKPQSDIGAQLIVQGKVTGNYDARAYQAIKGDLMPRVLQSFDQLCASADVVLVEGAGSASEINLRDGDIANMGFAVASDTPVILIGDIDRGGVIASIAGTYALLPEAEKALLKGYIVNKFRGDTSLFDNAIEMLAARTTLSCFGIVPYLSAARELPAEDSLALDKTDANTSESAIKIAVPQLLHIANFDDLDPLKAEPDVSVTLIPPGQALPGDADLVILPGTKATIPAMAHFREQGWDIDILAHRRRGGHVLGLCGGYQMLGRTIADPEGLEGQAGRIDGLGMLEVDTVIAAPKTLSPVTGVAARGLGAISGYEMHMGRTNGPGSENSFLTIDRRPDGAITSGGAVAGCYVHGLFAADGFRHKFLDNIRKRASQLEDFAAHVDGALDEIADQLEKALDIDALMAVAATRRRKC
jgi:adenosylcobyric acid synthase